MAARDARRPRLPWPDRQAVFDRSSGAARDGQVCYFQGHKEIADDYGGR